MYELYGAPKFQSAKLPELDFSAPRKSVVSRTQNIPALDRALGVLSGIGSVTQMGIGLAQIDDASPYKLQVNQYADLTRGGISSYEQLSDLYAENARGVNTPTADELRGMDAGQKAGSVFSSTMSGASAGAAFGLPGAIIGGIVGLGAGIGGMLVGDAKAQREADSLRAQAAEAKRNNQIRLGVEGDRIADRNYRRDMANIGARGGRLSTLQEFASNVLKKPYVPERKGTAVSFKKEYCNGGLKVSIRTK